MEPASNALVAVAKAAAEVAVPEAVRAFFEKRQRVAFDILIEELRTAKVSPDEAAARDEVAAMFVKFYHAMAQGAAFKNLRLIAKILAHKAAHVGERTDDFLMWADTIAGLLPEEAVLLAALHRHYADARARKKEPDKIHNQAMITLQQELVGARKTFATKEQLEATGTALTRTGFVILVSGWGGGMSFSPAPRLDELARLASLDAWAEDQI